MADAMTPDEVRAFLDSRPGWITLTTIGADGYPHSIPIGYFRVDERVYLGCRAGTQKLKNIERNPRVSLSLEAGRTMGDIKGVLIQGDARVHTEPESVLRLAREAARSRGEPEERWPTEPRPDAAYIEVVPRKVISWDYGKAGRRR
jgi:PPOX class probable F420-dependent enzyme